MQASNRRLERGSRLGGEPPADQHLDRRLIEVLWCEQGQPTIALSGGVFQNRLFLETLVTALRELGAEVLDHTRVPTNDGGLALGQAVVAAARRLRPGRDTGGA